MKKLIGTLALVLVCAAAYAAEPVYSLQSVALGVDSVDASTTETIGKVIDVRKQKDVMLQLSYKLSDSGTDVTVLKYGFSVDGTAPTAYTYSMNATNTGTTTVVQPLSIACGGAGYLHIISLQNADASGYMTNIALKYAIKMSAP